MIVQDVSAETIIMSRKYILMIATAAMFTYLYRVYCSICMLLSMDAKDMKEMHFVHMFDVHSTIVYRLAALFPSLDVTASISYNNGYDGQNSHPIKRVLRYHENI